MLDLESIELLAELATATVIVGLALEYTPAVIAYLKKPWFDRPRLRNALFHMIGPVFVIGGIASELSFHHISTGIQNVRDVEQRREIATISKRAATLEKEAADANERTVEIQKAAAWRMLSADQKGKDA